MRSNSQLYTAEFVEYILNKYNDVELEIAKLSKRRFEPYKMEDMLKEFKTRYAKEGKSVIV